MKNNPFLEWLEAWERNLPTLNLEEVVAEPHRVAVAAIDMTRGFCCEGPLASPRVKALIPTITQLFQHAHDLGVQLFILPQDTHDPDALEFSAYPPHAVEGTEQSKTVEELRGLPFSDRFVIMPKNSISCDIGTDLEPWLDDHPAVTTFIITGDCTDICVYQMAMFLRLRANVLGLEDVRVIVPANAVDTYDLPVATAEELGGLPHDGDLLHRIFLYHMALNGVEVVARLE